MSACAHARATTATNSERGHCVRARENSRQCFLPVSQQHHHQHQQQQQLFVANAEWRLCKEEEKSLELREGSTAKQRVFAVSAAVSAASASSPGHHICLHLRRAARARVHRRLLSHCSLCSIIPPHCSRRPLYLRRGHLGQMEATV